MKMYSFLLIASLASMTGCVAPPVCVDFSVDQKYAETQKKITDIQNARKENELIYSIPNKVKLVNFYNFNKVKVFYFGESKDSLADGVGKAIWMFGKDTLEFFDGYFKEGRYHGKGIRRIKIGQIYEGVWDSGFISGNYKITYSSGTVVTAKWIPKMNDLADIAYSNGDSYSGYISNGEPDSAGVYTWKSGERFEGNFKYGRLNAGTYIYSNGVKLDILINDSTSAFLKTNNVKNVFDNNVKMDMPEFDMAGFKKSLYYPCKSKENGFGEKVIVRFYLDIDGSIIKTQFLKPVVIPDEIQKSVLNSLYSVKITASKINGTPAKIMLAIPISFKLNK